MWLSIFVVQNRTTIISYPLGLSHILNFFLKITKNLMLPLKALILWVFWLVSKMWEFWTNLEKILKSKTICNTFLIYRLGIKQFGSYKNILNYPIILNKFRRSLPITCNWAAKNWEKKKKTFIICNWRSPIKLTLYKQSIFLMDLQCILGLYFYAIRVIYAAWDPKQIAILPD